VRTPLRGPMLPGVLTTAGSGPVAGGVPPGRRLGRTPSRGRASGRATRHGRATTGVQPAGQVLARPLWHAGGAGHVRRDAWTCSFDQSDVPAGPPGCCSPPWPRPAAARPASGQTPGYTAVSASGNLVRARSCGGPRQERAPGRENSTKGQRLGERADAVWGRRSGQRVGLAGEADPGRGGGGVGGGRGGGSGGNQSGSGPGVSEVGGRGLRVRWGEGDGTKWEGGRWTGGGEDWRSGAGFVEG